MDETKIDPSWAILDSLEVARKVLEEEALALKLCAERLDFSFNQIVESIVSCSGRIVVTGIGKSGHVGRKLAATLSSTGTPSFFVHAAEAGHGDLGMIGNSDLIIAISYSGESEEVVNLVSFAHQCGLKIIGLTRCKSTTVGRITDFHISCAVDREACPLGVAPTSSTTLQLALGDAIAMASMLRRNFSLKDFARTHPFGQLGRRYFLKVRDVMQGLDQIPTASPTSRLLDILSLMAIGRTGALLVLEEGKLAGIFTDSDLRRLIAQSEGKFDTLSLQPLQNFMSKTPLSIESSQLASKALQMFEEKRISRIVCLDRGIPVGLLSLQDLLSRSFVL
jgi:arabinose-5-phosphate isomerase